MYCISDDDYFKDFNMMLNGNIIDCFNEIKEIGTIVKEEIDRIYLTSNTTSSDKDLNSDKDKDLNNDKDLNSYVDLNINKNSDKKLNKKIILDNNVVYNDRQRYKETRINHNVREIENIRHSINRTNRISESKCKLFKKDKFGDLQGFKS
jgi:hypothetical protein